MPAARAATYRLVLSTAGDRDAARLLARSLVEAGLAACVQLVDIESIYSWHGTVHDEPEVLLLVKTRADLYDTLCDHVRARHPYETPEIVSIALDGGDPEYLSWIDTVLAPTAPVGEPGRPGSGGVDLT